MTNTTEQTIAALESTGNFKVLRRFSPVDVFCPKPADASIRRVMVIDSETTGLSAETDKMIEIGYVIAEFNRDNGQIYSVIKRHSGLEDPGFPLSEETKAITGITDEDLAGKSFDDITIIEDLQSVDIVIAHNALFDRPFLEARFPGFADKWWACSIKEGPWELLRTGSSKLEFLAYVIGGVFYDAHRALVDAEVLLYLLSCNVEGNPIFGYILASSRQTTFRVWATGASFDTKEVLKSNDYKWSDGTDPRRPIKAWYKEGLVAMQGEIEFLANQIFLNGGKVVVDKLTGRERYTDRQASRDYIDVPKRESLSSNGDQQ